jgi:hypothetical protein
MDLFEKAAKNKIRFETDKGYLTCEDLFDLPLTQMDILARAINQKVKDASVESFITKKPKVSAELDLKFSIVKRVIEIRLKDIETAEKYLVDKARRDKILDIIVDKEDDDLKSMDVKDLKKMAKKL